MKKAILIALLLVGMTSTAFASQVGASPGTSLGSTVFKTSQNVKLFATSTATSYSCASKHTSGDTVYTSTGDSATIAESQAAGYKGDDITNESGAGPSA